MTIIVLRKEEQDVANLDRLTICASAPALRCLRDARLALSRTWINDTTGASDRRTSFFCEEAGTLDPLAGAPFGVSNGI
jgi:hypothetical protein